jgi:hypothetical protein
MKFQKKIYEEGVYVKINQKRKGLITGYMYIPFNEYVKFNGKSISFNLGGYRVVFPRNPLFAFIQSKVEEVK